MIQPDDITTKGVGPLLRLFTRFMPYLYLSVTNYYRRPKKLKLNFGQKHFLFESASNIKHNYVFPCLIIDNPSDKQYRIAPDSIRINKETYSHCVQSNPIFSRCREGTKIELKLNCLDKKNLCSFFITNWQEIQNIAPPLILDAHDKLVLPLFLHRDPHFIVGKFADSLLWFPQTKISVRFRINSIDVEYGIKRLTVYESSINWLGFWDSKYTHTNNPQPTNQNTN